MKKLSCLIITCLILLTSCNLPINSSTPDPNEIATRVAQTMSALPSATITQPAATLEQPTATSEQPTQTFTLTPTETATATTSPADPKLTLGDPTWSDSLDSYTAFFRAADYPFKDDAVKITVENGAMVFKSLHTSGGRRWRLTSRDPRNLYLEATFKTVSCSGDDQYGLVFRAPTYGDGYGYYFGVTCSGSYYLLKWTTSGSDLVIDTTPDARILSGAGQTNRLGVMAIDNSIKLYVNGALVKEISDSSIKDKGYIGAFVSAVDDPGFTVQMEQISSWTLP